MWCWNRNENIDEKKKKSLLWAKECLFYDKLLNGLEIWEFKEPGAGAPKLPKLCKPFDHDSTDVYEVKL